LKPVGPDNVLLSNDLHVACGRRKKSET
jgi:hypothetical protein